MPAPPPLLADGGVLGAADRDRLGVARIRAVLHPEGLEIPEIRQLPDQLEHPAPFVVPLQAQLAHQLADRKTHRHRAGVAHRLPGVFDHFAQQAHAVLERAPVLVVSACRHRCCSRGAPGRSGSWSSPARSVPARKGCRIWDLWPRSCYSRVAPSGTFMSDSCPRHGAHRYLLAATSLGPASPPAVSSPPS